MRQPPSDGKPFQLEFYEERGVKFVLRWLRDELEPDERRFLGTAMSEVLQELGSGVCDSEWGKWVAPGIFEFRARDADYFFRVYCHEIDGALVLLLHGYDKSEHPHKNYETEQIELAVKRLTAYQEDQTRQAKREAKSEADARSRAGQGPGRAG